MATTTTNLKLTKPSDSDAPDISVINDNMDKIDIAVAGIEIGGRNLALDTGNLSSRMFGSINNVTFDTAEDNEVPSKQCLTVKMTSVNASSSGIYYGSNNYISKLKVGDEITVSFYAKCSQARRMVYTLEFCSKASELWLTSEWKKFSLTGTVDHVTGSGLAVTFYSSYFEVGDVLYISSIKVERGNKATDWTPAIEDTEAEIQSVDNKLTTNLLKPTLATTTKNGVTCTNNGDGTYTLDTGGNEASGTAWFSGESKLGSITLQKGTYKLVGWDTNKQGIKDSVMMYLNEKTSIFDYGQGGTIFTVDKESTFNVCIVVYKGKTLDDVLIKPMITTNLNATYDDFVPYTGSTGQLNSDVADIQQNMATIELGTDITE